MQVTLIKAIAGLVGGGGGGRPNMAQAGGKNPAGIQEVTEKSSRSTGRTTFLKKMGKNQLTLCRKICYNSL